MKRFFQQLLKDFQTGNSQTDHPVEHHSVTLAACVIFLEIAATDNDLAKTELEQISTILKNHYDLSDHEVTDLFENAETARKSSVDLYSFTRVINDVVSTEQKKELMEQIWRIIYADGRLDKHEDHLVHKLAKLLHIDHREMISAKLKIKSENKIK